MSENFTRKKARRYNTFRILAATIFLVFIAVGSLYGVEKFNNPSLEGTWQSIDTGEMITFSKDGEVKVKDSTYIPKYEVVSPNKMQYTIEDKDFTMQYFIEGRILKWGIEGQELEEFKRN